MGDNRIGTVGSSKRQELYLNLFRGGAGAKIRGESSTVYTKWPQVNGAAERIFGSNADSRLIYVMRNPALR